MYEICNFIMTKLNEERKLGLNCDLKLCIDDVTFWAHSTIFSVTSAIISDKFRLSTKCVTPVCPIVITSSHPKNVSCVKCMQTFMDVMYGQSVDALETEHVLHFESIMNFFKLKLEFVDVVSQYLKKNFSATSDVTHSTTVVKSEISSNTITKSSKVLASKRAANIKPPLSQTQRTRTVNYKSQTNAKLIFCLECKYTCYKPSDMLLHLLSTKHGNNVCSLCLYTVDNYHQFDSHLKKHDNIKVFFCNICDQRFQTRALLSQHLPVHSSVTPYQCSYCPKAFKWKHGLNSHLIVHSNEKKHLCDECGFSTTHSKTLRAHKLTHTGDMFKCNIAGCSHTSSRKENMKIHLKTHLKEKPYVCEVCGLNFTQNKNLQRHSQIHYKDNMTINTCPHCPFQAIRSDNLKAHMARQHTEKPMKLELTEQFADLMDSSEFCIRESDKNVTVAGPRSANHLTVLADAASTCPKIDDQLGLESRGYNSLLVRNFDSLISNPSSHKIDGSDEVLMVYLLPEEVKSITEI